MPKFSGGGGESVLYAECCVFFRPDGHGFSLIGLKRPNPPTPFPAREGGARKIPPVVCFGRKGESCSPLGIGEGLGRGLGKDLPSNDYAPTGGRGECRGVLGGCCQVADV